MKLRFLITVGISAAIVAVLFYKTVTAGLVPFPGDILVSDFQPWRSATYLGYNPGSFPTKAQYPDTIRQLYPWRIAAVNALKNGELPLWNPYNFSGSPLLANFQSAALYPFNFLFFLLPDIGAWTILVMLQPLLSVLFTYLYARKIGLNRYGSWLCALSFGISGFMAVWLQYNTVGHVILWLPLLVLSVENIRSKPEVLWLGMLTAAIAASIFAGHPQVFAYMLLYVSSYAFFRLPPRMRWYAGGFALLGLGIGAVQVIPGLELISLAARSPHDPAHLYDTILIKPWQLLSMAFPNIFGNPATRTYWPADTFVGKVTTIGLVPLFFLFSALRRKDSLSRWFLFSSAAVLMLITDNPVTRILYRLPVPLITSSSPTLMSFLFAFSFSLLSGMGLEYFMTDRHTIKKLIRRTLEVLAVITALALLTRIPLIPAFSGHSGTVLRALVYGSAVSGAVLAMFFIAVLRPRYMKHVMIVLLFVHFIDLAIFFWRFNPFVPPALVFPGHPVIDFMTRKAPDRYWGYGTANIAANFATYYGMFSPEGYDPLYPKTYGEFLYSYRDGSIFTSFDNRTRSDAAISSHFGDGGLSDTNKQRVLNELSVRYILDRVENAADATIFPPDIYTKIHATGDWNIYENTAARPRAYIDYGTASILSYTPDSVTIRTQSTRSGTMVLTDTYYPGWNAWVDGNPAEIIRVQHALRGVTVPAGEHTLEMRYRPLSVWVGVYVSILSLMAAGLWLVRIRKKTP